LKIAQASSLPFFSSLPAAENVNDANKITKVERRKEEKH
jgi:hypothetical protein